MGKRYLVVDQNYLRTPQLQVLLGADNLSRFVLPDLALLEMTKGAHRELTLTQSLAQLSRYPQRVVVAKAMSACLQNELTKKQSASGYLVHKEGTDFLRKILDAVATGNKNRELAQVLEDLDGHIPALEAEYLDHAANKNRAMELVDAAKLDMPPDFAKRVRNGTATFQERLAFVHERACSLSVAVLADFGFSREKAIAFIRTKPLLLRYFYLNIWNCLEWERHGRLESMVDRRVSNDLLDREYVIAATSFEGLLTNEKRMNEAYETVLQLIKQRV